MRELFVYYRVDEVVAATARDAVEAMQARLHRACPGLRARLLVRDGDSATLQTWMETYALAGSPEGVDAEVESRIAAEATTWSHLVAGSRHVEAFTAAEDG